MSKYCDVWFVRHGETAWNAKGLLQGHNDIPLNETGIAQAQQLNELLSPIHFAAVFSSDLSRAQKTAELAIHPREIPHIINPTLRERYMGPFEGKSVHDMDATYRAHSPITAHLPKEEYLSYKHHPEVESLAEVFQRVQKFLTDSITPYLGSSILVVAHGGVIRSILDHFDFVPQHKWIIQNCGFVRFNANHDELILSHRQGVTKHSYH